ncbi:hypothetical protein CEXT_286421 [Caerostris extrusa]|uniref:Uncharacterized protein n=1 Tax=Caerostris extrusa TaxID=172846 RepID=A0AAV4S496_CAEEX|nr:hypothetical protein CEXT_286421 [Caerostris extrusa]
MTGEQRKPLPLTVCIDCCRSSPARGLLETGRAAGSIVGDGRRKGHRPKRDGHRGAQEGEDLLTEITCQASNTNLSAPITAAVKLDISRKYSTSRNNRMKPE